MKRLTLLAMTAVIGGGVMAQNVWDGSAVSTISTGGRVAVGANAPLSGYMTSFVNTNNALTHNTVVQTNNTNTSGQIGLNVYSVYNATTGTTNKYGIYNVAASSATGDLYGSANFVGVSNSGRRYGVVATVTPTIAGSTGVRCAVYGNVVDGTFIAMTMTKPNENRAGFFVGSTEIISATAAEKAFIINRRDIGVAGVGTNVFQVLGSGKVYATEINVQLTPFPDYVFLPDYDLMPLSEVKDYISENGHLPNVPTAETVAEKGLDLGEMNRVLVEKVEELTLYLLQQEERIQALEAQVKAVQQD